MLHGKRDPKKAGDSSKITLCGMLFLGSGGAPNRPAIEFRAMSIIQDLAKFCGEYRRCEAARGLPVGGERPADAKRVASL